MQDRVSLYPGRVKLEPVAGQANLYDLTRADQPTQEGTPLNKASLLKDTTAALFGKTNAAVPDDILNLLSKSVIAHETKITDVLGNLIAIPVDQIKGGVKIATGSYTGTGTYGESNPNSLTFAFAPKLVFIFVHPRSSSSADNAIIPAISLDNVYKNGGYLHGTLRNLVNGYAKIEGNTVYWYYSMSGAAAQMNELGWKHSYIAIG